MRRLMLAPMLALIGSCVNQATQIQTSPLVPEPAPAPAPAPAQIEGATLVELNYGRFQILYAYQLGEPHRFTYTPDAAEGALRQRGEFGSRSGRRDAIESYRVTQYAAMLRLWP